MIKKDELKKLKEAEKIELVKTNRVKGFTSDMVKTIVNRLIEAFNNNEVENIEIKANNFKMTVYPNKLNIINILDKFHAKIKVAAVEKSKELTKEELKELVTSGVMTDIEYIEALKDIKVIEHKNAVTGHIYKGNNAELLDNAMKDNNYKESLWLASGQAKKMNKQVKTGASGVLIKVYYEDEYGRSFCKLEKIYNVEELEPIQKIENTEKYKNLVEKLRA